MTTGVSPAHYGVLMDSSSQTAAAQVGEIVALAKTELLRGDGWAAASRLRQAIAGGTFDLRLNYWLAAALGRTGDWSGHETALGEAKLLHAMHVIAEAGGDLDRLHQDPDYADAVGSQFYGHRFVAVAAVGFAQAVSVERPSLERLIAFGLSLQHQGRMVEATEAFAQAEQRHPGRGAFSFLLYSLFHAEQGVRRHAEAARLWRANYGDRARKAPLQWPGPIQGRPLRVGYVVPGLGGQARQFLTPVLEHHDPSRINAILYMHEIGPAPAGIEVRGVGRLDDDAFADLVRADRIDVLVDLWGHTAQGRLGVFVHKPAPVQVSWLNYVQTTGVPEIDYLVHCDCMHTPDAQDDCVETIWGLGPIIAPFRPDPRPTPTPTPARANGFVTFGSYNHPSRLNDQTVDAWARILLRTPGSRLLLRYSYFADPVLQNATLIRFAARGVDPDRIACLPALTQPDYYRSFGEIDVALDPSPCPGGTTSLDAVANGVPLLTLAGADFYSRIGIAVVGPLGLDQLVAHSWDDYVERAARLAADVEALDALRTRVRILFDDSGRRDEAGFTRTLEDALRQMFADKRAEHERAEAA